MKHFETLFSQKFCDSCSQYSDTLNQSEDGEWLCPVCEEKQTCNECGTITDEVPMNEDGLCFDCVGLTAEDFKIDAVVGMMHNQANEPI